MRKRRSSRLIMILATSLGLGGLLPACAQLAEEERATENGALVLHMTDIMHTLSAEIRVDRFGRVNPKTGVAVISGVAFCSEPATVEFDESELRQERGQNLAFDSFFRSFSCEGVTPFEITLPGDEGTFRGGPAELTLDIFVASDDHGQVSNCTTTTVMLRGGQDMP